MKLWILQYLGPSGRRRNNGGTGEPSSQPETQLCSHFQAQFTVKVKYMKLHLSADIRVYLSAGIWVCLPADISIYLSADLVCQHLCKTISVDLNADFCIPPWIFDCICHLWAAAYKLLSTIVQILLGSSVCLPLSTSVCRHSGASVCRHSGASVCRHSVYNAWIACTEGFQAELCLSANSLKKICWKNNMHRQFSCIPD